MPRGTAAQRKSVAELHAKGLGRNTIARELGISAGQVTNIARDLGLSFDRTATAVATEARKADCADRRSRLEEQLLDDAERLRAQVWAPHEYIDHGGKEFVEVRWLQDEPTPADKLKLIQAARQALDGSLRITQLDAEAGDAPVKAMLTELGRALGVLPADGDDQADDAAD
jgi:hypothetical protein